MVCKFDANIWNVIHFDFDNFTIHINKNVLAVCTSSEYNNSVKCIQELDFALKCITGYQLQSPFVTEATAAVAVKVVRAAAAAAAAATTTVTETSFVLVLVVVVVVTVPSVYACATATVYKLENEMHSIDTIRLLNCCSFCSWQSTSQIKLFPKSTDAFLHTRHNKG